MFKLIMIYLFSAFSGLSGAVTYQSPEDINYIIAEKTYDGGITEFSLKNGMKVVVKPTHFESDEIFIRIAAIGGVASLPEKDQPAANLAAQMAWESGLGHWTSDQVSVFLYEHSMEVQPKIQAYSRLIEGTSDEDGLESYLELINLYFTGGRFTKEGFDTVINQTKESLSKKRSDFDATFEEAVRAANTKNFISPHHVHLSDLDTIKLETAKEIYLKAFSNPAEFNTVIVGSFELDDVKPLVNRYLGSIPEAPAGTEWPKFTKETGFVSGVIEKIVGIHTRADSLTRITIPILIPINEQNLRKIEVLCQIIEGRLRKLFRDRMKTSYGIDVGYELPMYPSLKMPWMTLQYRSEASKIKALNTIILEELKRLEVIGPTPEEIADAISQQNRSDEFWLKDNYFWVATLSNYTLWGWNPAGIQKPIPSAGVSDLTPATVKEMLKKDVSTDSYSIISAQPL